MGLTKEIYKPWNETFPHPNGDGFVDDCVMVNLVKRVEVNEGENHRIHTFLWVVIDIV